MITRDNIGAILKELNPDTIRTLLDRDGDYITLEVHYSNSGHSIMLQSTHYDQEQHDEITGNGNLFCDKDDFLMLLEEQGIEIED